MSLEVGTVETTVEKEKKRRNRPGLTGGGTGGNGRKRGGGGGGGGGDDSRHDDFPTEEIEEYRPNKLRVGMWFLLLVVVMTFGGLVSAYVVLATNKTLEWQPFDLPIQIWLSTFLILISTATFEIARRKLDQRRQTAAKNWLLATTAFGGMFIASQLLAWFQLVRLGVYVQSNPYAGFFYILTAVHAVHVIGGICALGYIVLRTWRETRNEVEFLKRKTAVTVVSWYWHAMDALWLVLFVLLGFYK